MPRQRLVMIALLAGCRPLPNPGSTLYSTQGECEQATKKACQFQRCDYVPPGKTVEEVCGGNYWKRWVPTAQPPTPATWGSYTSYGLGPAFRLQYPRDWVVVEGPNVQDANRYVGTPVVQVKAPGGYQAGTNLAGVSVTVSQGGDPRALSSCTFRVEPLGLPLEIEVPTSRDKSTWAIARHTGAAAGSRYEQTIYRSHRGNVCVELLATIQSGEINNYPTTVREFDREPISVLLERIVASFTFLEPPPPPADLSQ